MNVAQDSSTAMARAALSRLFEPSDAVGLALVAAAGPLDALRIATGDLKAAGDLRQEIQELLAPGERQSNLLDRALERWAPRRNDLAPERDLATLARFGGRLLTPEAEDWPAALEDLQLAAPVCLWARGPAEIPPLQRMVAVVGSRDSTNYGASVTAEMASGLAMKGLTILSGGAYGIDAQAHRAALGTSGTAQPPTIAVMACGVDRYYPAGHEELLRTIAQDGLVISEVPPGSSPTRWRFLARNRLIAALGAVTVVVEARWRSGALNTAHHAAGLGRPVGAVPGSVFSANSAGCHRLLRDGSAICVTEASEVAELVGPLGTNAETEVSVPSSDHDGLAVQDILLLDALPLRIYSSIDKLASVAGLGSRDVLAGLARLELAGLALRGPEGWKRTPKS
ncbi:MAG: Rossmann fold nucleotide-binding protein Smf possibly involved in DNA uptake [uncultured Arthrobacter sp.]|uniref:Rossmann fold nucleotide-binding protein Smf possibly involved in DNA uptake n=1 Tax=uncultured Arthrobacter sp. TaxID=114050 RepID=A0A6J4IPK8_9MICC|nr:DNA-processing protein DprA [uncultured Arthrobacter sp.]CAA9255987.1 MAG: Rossmann fold nucleotide-binding protein Smf possibly involved in DNA uptake [uncultured Arthrobacter sp.]